MINWINWINNKDINKNLVDVLLNTCIKTNQFTNYGTNTRKLESLIKDKFKIDDNKVVIVVSNGTSALHSLTAGIQYYNNTKINWATQAFTFPSSAQGYLGNNKILDIDTEGGLCLSEVDKNPDINGIIVTNIFGNIVNIDKYLTYCKNNNIYLIFDNAASSYTFYKNKNCINYGIGCAISLHHTKPFGFGEGGAIIVDKEYEDTIRKINNFGINLEKEQYSHIIGNNYKMSEISAIYIYQYLLCNFLNIIKHNNMLYNYFIKRYNELKINHFKLYKSFHDDIIVPSCICIIFNNKNNSYKYLDILIKNNISARKYYYPLKKLYNSVDIFNNVLCIPCNIDVSIEHMDKILLLLSVKEII